MSAPTTWEKLPALDGRPNPCGCCPDIAAVFHLDSVIAVGFGDAQVTRDDETVYREPHDPPHCEACEGRGWFDDGTVMVVLRTCEACAGTGFVGESAVYWDGREAEKRAAADPDHDWRIILFGPLHGEVYQRHGPNAWLLIEKNQGFA